MKTIALIFCGILTFFLFFAGCLVTITGDVTVNPPDSGNKINLIIAGIITIYEVTVRVIPSIGDYSPISWAIRLLKWVSDGLNRKPY